VRPGSDTAVLAWLCRELLGERPDVDPADVATLREVLAPFTLERANQAAGVDVAPVLDEVRANVGRLAVMCGTGLTMSRDGVLAEWLRWTLLALTGSLDTPEGMRFNRGMVMRLARNMHPVAKPGPPTRPELRSVIGQYPCVAMVDEIEAGNLRSLVIGGGNPLSAFPDKDRTRAALASLDVLAVVDVAASELTDLATHVLPAAGQLERGDLTLAEHVSIRSGMQFTPPVVAPAAERKPVWWIFGQLARRMGGDILGGADPDQLTDELYLGGIVGPGVVAAGPHGVDVPHEYGWVAEALLPEGRWRLAPAELVERLRHHRPPTGDGLVLVNRRDVRRLNSLAYATGVEAQVRLHPDDAGGLVAGDDAVVTSAHGSLVGTVAIDPTLRPGTVSVNHGRAGADVAVLTSGTIDVDPLTGMPLASGLPVTVARTGSGAGVPAR
jgi:anaerobic selenocysteine-containing dehydrogenase